MKIQRAPMIIAGERRGWGKGTVVTGAKGYVFLGGAVGFDMETGTVPESIGEQTKKTMENIKEALEEYGSSLKNILFMRRYIKGQFPNGICNDPAYQESMDALQDFWRENCPEFLAENTPPASALIGVTALAYPQLKIEIEIITAIP